METFDSSLPSKISYMNASSNSYNPLGYDPVSVTRSKHFQNIRLAIRNLNNLFTRSKTSSAITNRPLLRAISAMEGLLNISATWEPEEATTSISRTWVRIHLLLQAPTCKDLAITLPLNSLSYPQGMA
jgi:hypothetical protein